MKRNFDMNGGPNASLVEASAVVVAIEGDMAVLETTRTNACSGCGVSGACGTSTLGEIFGRKRNFLRIENNFEAQKGEKIIIGLPENDLVLASLAAYMMPLGLMIISALLVMALGGTDAQAALACLISLAGGLWLAGRMTAKAGQRFSPRFLRRAALPFSFRAGQTGSCSQ